MSNEGSVREITYREAIREAIRLEMRRDPTVFVMGTDLVARGGSFAIHTGLYEEFGGERVRDTPISEGAIVGSGLGAALTGMRPIVEVSHMDFITIAMDQIVNQVAKIRYMMGGQPKVPMVIRTAGGAGKGNAAQHSQSLEAWFVHVPGLYVVTPATPYDAKGLLISAIRDDNPVLFVDHRMAYNLKGPVPEESYLVPLGMAEVKRVGRDVTIAANAMMVHRALAAAEDLVGEGIEAEVIDLRSLVPLDAETLVTSVKKTGRLVVVHEGSTRAGIGAEIVAQMVDLAFDYLDAPPKRVGSLDVHVPYSRKLESMVIPGKERIIRACREACGGREQSKASDVSPATAAAPSASPLLEVKLPKYTTTMEEGTIVRWLKREGDAVQKGEPLFHMETDKADMEVESPYSGKLVRIVAPEGATLPILSTIALMAEGR